MSIQLGYKIIEPRTDKQFSQYYDFRWLLLRKPWQQAKGSEKDEFENAAEHRMAMLDDQIIAVGRLHYINNKTAQIRYMAVKTAYGNEGVGKKLYFELENIALSNNIELIILNAREQAIGFYKKMGFEVIKKTHILFNEIQHYELQKKLGN